jgi:hypothetical protein
MVLFDWKTKPKTIYLDILVTFDQLVIFWIDHKMVFLTGQIKPKNWAIKKLIKKYPNFKK